VHVKINVKNDLTGAAIVDKENENKEKKDWKRKVNLEDVDIVKVT